MSTSLLRHKQHSHGKQHLKRCVLRRLRKTGSDCADVTCCGRLFQTRASAPGKARSPVTVFIAYARVSRFCSCHLDFNPITLVCKSNLDISKMYPHTENELSRSRLLEVRTRTGQTDRQTDATERIITAGFAGVTRLPFSRRQTIRE